MVALKSEKLLCREPAAILVWAPLLELTSEEGSVAQWGEGCWGEGCQEATTPETKFLGAPVGLPFPQALLPLLSTFAQPQLTTVQPFSA